MNNEDKRSKKLGLNEEEIAFYDALLDHNGVREVMGDEKLMIIARELVESLRKNVTIDWTMKENVQAKIRLMVKKILKNYGYPPDKQQKAIETVLEQAKILCKDWAEVKEPSPTYNGYAVAPVEFAVTEKKGSYKKSQK